MFIILICFLCMAGDLFDKHQPQYGFGVLVLAVVLLIVSRQYDLD